MDREEWRAIPSWPAYEASSHGRIRRAAPWKDGRSISVHHIMSQHAGRGGYVIVHLRSSPKSANVLVHRLVCEAFHGPAPSGTHQAAHGNGIRNDNRPENIRWCLPAENCADKVLHGTAGIGERHSMAVLTAAQVAEIRARYVKGRGNGSFALAREFGIHPKHLRRVAIRDCWKSE